MVLIPKETDPTLDAIDAQIVAANPPSSRFYLGASVLGQSCMRQLWYALRWAMVVFFDARTLRLFEDGHYTEKQTADRIRMVPGVKLWTHKADGQQFGVEAFGGHLRGHKDGVVLGLLQAPKTPHIWEHKSANEKKFKELQKKVSTVGEKNALEAWNPVYFTQAQIYMGLSEDKEKDVPRIERHWLTCSTPGGRDLTSVRTNFQKDRFEEFLERGHQIIFSLTPPERISESPEWYECKWCKFQDVCHHQHTAQVSCRTCVHVTPEKDGTWHCAFHDKTLNGKEQRKGCPKHLFIPDLVPWGQLEDMNKEENTISYRIGSEKVVTNAERSDFSKFIFTSKDMVHLDAKILLSDTAQFLESTAPLMPTIVDRKRPKKPRNPIPFDDPLNLIDER